MLEHNLSRFPGMGFLFPADIGEVYTTCGGLVSHGLQDFHELKYNAFIRVNPWYPAISACPR
jgi:hypothetical protein